LIDLNERLGFSERITRLGKNLGGAVLSPAKLVWDVATAPLNDAEEFNGISNTLKTSVGNFVKSVGRPIGNLLSDIDAINRTFIREPLGTASLAIWEMRNNDVDFSAAWEKAWEARNEVSLGQSLAANIFSNTFTRSAFVDESKGANLFNEFDIFNREIDLAKEAQVALRDGVEGVVNKYSTPIKNYRDNGIGYALSTDFVKSSDDPGTLGYLLGTAKTDDEVAFTMRAALGDKTALTELQKLRPSNAAAMNKMFGNLSEADKNVIAPLFDPQTGRILDINENPKALSEAGFEYDDLYQNNDFFKKFVDTFESPSQKGVGTTDKMVTRTFGTSERYKRFEDFIAKGRVTKLLGNPKPGSSTVEFFQPTRWNRAYARVTWAAGERPAYIANINSPDSYQEILASVNRARKVIGNQKVDAAGKMIYEGFSADDASRIIKEYSAATTPEQRSIVILKLEEEVVNKVAQKHGISSERAKEIFDGNTRAKQSALASFKERGYGLDKNGDLIKVPIYESQTANHMPIMDFDVLDRTIQNNLSVLKGPLTLKDSVVDLADVMQDLFKVGVLLRLGYTTRNAVDSQLRIMAAYGPMIALKNIPKGIGNFITNASTVPGRLVDNIKVWRGKETVSSYRSRIDVEARQLGKQIGEIESNIKALDDKIAKVEAGPVIPEFQAEGYTVDESLIIKFGNDQSVQKVIDKQNEIFVNNPRFLKDVDKEFYDTVEYPVSDEMNEILSYTRSKAQEGVLKKKGLFPLKVILDGLEGRGPLGQVGGPEYIEAIIKRGRADYVDKVDDFGINTQGVVQAELSPGGFGKGEWEQISITDGRSKTRYVKVDWFPSTAKKNEFIEEAKERFYRESYTPDELRASLKAQEEQHAAKYLQNWDPDTSLYYDERFRIYWSSNYYP